MKQERETTAHQVSARLTELWESFEELLVASFEHVHLVMKIKLQQPLRSTE